MCARVEGTVYGYNFTVYGGMVSHVEAVGRVAVPRHEEELAVVREQALPPCHAS